MQTTYSFLDTVVIIACPVIPIPITITGEGAGSVSVTMSAERTAIDYAADGAIMISKLAGNHGTVSINVQQTSTAHRDLLLLYNALIIAPPASWALSAMTIRNVANGSAHLCTGVAFSKVPDKSYQKEGQHVTWSFICADIENATV